MKIVLEAFEDKIHVFRKTYHEHITFLNLGDMR